MISNQTCKDLVNNISQYINGDLSILEMKRYTQHILTCKKCSEFASKEEKFESYLSSSMKYDLDSLSVEPKMVDLQNEIMNKIKTTEQINLKTPLNKLETFNLKSSSKKNNTNLISNFTRPALTFIPAFSLLLVLTMLIYTGQKGLRERDNKGTLISYSKEFKILTKYNHKRSLAVLYGSTLNQTYNSFITSFTEKIAPLDKELQNTIFHKIEKMDFFIPKIKKEKILSNINYVKGD